MCIHVFYSSVNLYAFFSQCKGLDNDGVEERESFYLSFFQQKENITVCVWTKALYSAFLKIDLQTEKDLLTMKLLQVPELDQKKVVNLCFHLSVLFQ